MEEHGLCVEAQSGSGEVEERMGSGSGGRVPTPSVIPLAAPQTASPFQLSQPPPPPCIGRFGTADKHEQQKKEYLPHIGQHGCQLDRESEATALSVRRKSKADHWRSLHLHSLGTKGSLRSLSKQHAEATFILAHLSTNLLFKSVILFKKISSGLES